VFIAGVEIFSIDVLYDEELRLIINGRILAVLYG
jgi:hypothetical protein